jgi:hypothetical protein
MDKALESRALGRLILDIPNGGFLQFFCNWGYEDFQHAVRGLEWMGAREYVGHLQQSYSVIEKYQDDPRIGELWDLPKVIRPEDLERLRKLDQILCDSLDKVSALKRRFYDV